MESIIKFEGVNKSFGKANVIKNASFEVKENSICGFVGPNGAGKTTIIKLLLGIIPKNDGKILFNNNEDVDISQIGTIVGGPAFYPNLDASKNILLVAAMKDIKISDKEISDLLELVGLGNVGNKKVKNYSLGMKQRLSIAMSLVGDPKVLIWDEPINGLDPEGILDVRLLIEKIHKERNTTFLISSHILNELDKVINALILIRAGEIIYNGSIDDFLKEYDKESLEEAYMSCIEKSKRGE